MPGAAMSSQAVHPISTRRRAPGLGDDLRELLRGRGRDADDHAHRLQLHQVVERGLGRLDAEARVLEAGGRVEAAVGRLDRVVRVGATSRRVRGVAELGRCRRCGAALGLWVHLDGDRAVGADRVAARDPGGLDDRQGRAEGAAGGDDDGVRARGAAQRVPHLGVHPPVVVDEGAVDVEADQQRLPVRAGRGARPDAPARRCGRWS